MVDCRERDKAKREHWILAGGLWCSGLLDTLFRVHRQLVGGVQYLLGSKLIVNVNVNRVFSMIIVPKTARHFHEVLLETTMR
jgi:hypothetical protein